MPERGCQGLALARGLPWRAFCCHAMGVTGASSRLARALLLGKAKRMTETAWRVTEAKRSGALTSSLWHGDSARGGGPHPLSGQSSVIRGQWVEKEVSGRIGALGVISLR